MKAIGILIKNGRGNDHKVGEKTWNVNTKLDKNYKVFCLNSTGVK